MAPSDLTFEAEVSHLSQQGFGVIKGPDRITYFVRGTWRGDRGIFRVTDEHDGTYRFAALLQLLERSSDRVEAPCPYLGQGPTQCFGCPWMMVDYSAQLQEKLHRVRYALQRVGLPSASVRDIWPSPKIFGYRRRAQFKTDGQQIGYAGKQGLAIAPVATCAILTSKMQQHLDRLQQKLPFAPWQPSGGHIWNYLDLDEASDPEELPINQRRPFQQANGDQNLRMRDWLKSHMEQESPSAAVLELFAGSGNFTEILVEIGLQEILALEVGAEAVEGLSSKNWPGVRALRMNLYQPKALQELAQLAALSEILVVNPPRDGLRQLNQLPKVLPKLRSIYYISCDPVSFASDASRLYRMGFHLQEVQVLDQMPHTPHLEILAKLQKL